MSNFNLDDYVTVAERIAEFYAKFPEGSLQSEVVELTDKRVVIRASAYRSGTDEKPAIAHSALGIPGTTPYTRGSEIENAETSAAGRAIAFLGFGVKKSVASRDEIQGKREDGPSPKGAAAQRTTHRDGLIGKAIAQGTQDFALRQGPDGPVLPFRIKEGRLSQIAVATGAIAVALDTYREEVLGSRVTVWGTYSDETYTKKDKGEEYDVTYKVLHVERIKTSVFDIPVEQPSDEPPVEAESIPWMPLDEDEKAAIAGSLPA